MKVKFQMPFTIQVPGKAPVTTYDELEAKRLLGTPIPGSPTVKLQRLRITLPILLQYGLPPVIEGEIETERADVIEVLQKVPGLRAAPQAIEEFKASPAAQVPPPPLVVVLPDFDTMHKDEMILWANDNHKIVLDRRKTAEVLRKELRSHLKKDGVIK